MSGSYGPDAARLAEQDRLLNGAPVELREPYLKSLIRLDVGEQELGLSKEILAICNKQVAAAERLLTLCKVELALRLASTIIFSVGMAVAGVIGITTGLLVPLLVVGGTAILLTAACRVGVRVCGRLSAATRKNKDDQEATRLALTKERDVLSETLEIFF